MDESIFEVPVTEGKEPPVWDLGDLGAGAGGAAGATGYTPTPPTPPASVPPPSSAAPTVPPPPGFEAAPPPPPPSTPTAEGFLPTPGAGYEFQVPSTGSATAPQSAGAPSSATAPPASSPSAGYAPSSAATPPSSASAPPSGYAPSGAASAASGYGAPSAPPPAPGYAPASATAPAYDAPPPPPGAPSYQAPAGFPAPAAYAPAATVYEQADPAAQAPIREALQAVVDLGGSDLHVSANAAPMVRIDGSLHVLDGMPIWTADDVSRNLRAIMSPRQQATFDHDLELDFAYGLSEGFRFRANIYQQRESMGAAFRLIPTEIKTLDELGLPPVIAKFADLPRGLVLVTGPTGSGKSTTLAALIDLANSTRSDHIMTVEDPIEFLHVNKRSLVNQREVGADTHDFKAALKHVLRQDPDIILIGELRDHETMSVALTAAETGHLVFATLHTQSAAQTIDRIIDVFEPHQQGQVRAQLASTLQGVVCQTLVKRAAGRGRMVATEVLSMTPAVSNLIREGKTYQVSSAMQAGRAHGMHTMDQHLAELVNSGDVPYGAAAEKAQNLEDFNRLVHRVGDTNPEGYSAGYGAGN